MIHRNNERFRYLDDHHQTILYRKQNKEKDKFDRIVFASRGINEMKIQSFIKIVELYSFDRCNNLNQIELCENSSLEIINENSFSHSSLQTISTPPQIKTISSGAFWHFDQLSHVNINENSQLEIIGESSFSYSPIKNFIIPNKDKLIGEKAFYLWKFLRSVDINENCQLEKIESKAFTGFLIKGILIPKKVDVNETYTCLSYSKLSSTDFLSDDIKIKKLLWEVLNSI